MRAFMDAGCADGVKSVHQSCKSLSLQRRDSFVWRYSSLLLRQSPLDQFPNQLQRNTTTPLLLLKRHLI